MLSKEDIAVLRITSMKLAIKEDASKPDKYLAICRFIIDQTRILLLDTSGNPKSVFEILWNIRKIIDFIRMLIFMVKSAIGA